MQQTLLNELELFNLELKSRPCKFKTYEDLVNDQEFEDQTGISSKVLAKVEQDQIRGLVNKTLAFADSPGDMINKISRIIDLALENKTQKGLSKIKVFKAELNKQMYQMAGADTGYYKNDYKVFMEAKQDKVIGSTLELIEKQINRLTEYIKSTEI